MGLMNYAVNRLLERKDIFADFVNGALFEGRDMIHADKLELMSPNAGTLYMDEKGILKVRETRGDIRMKAEEQLYSVMIAMEPQNKVDYAMPVRVMEYVVMEYRKQVQDLEKQHKDEGKRGRDGQEFLSGLQREDKLTPVIAIVLYCDSEKEWNGSMGLYEMIEWGDDPNAMLELERYMSDFKVNMIHMKELGNLKIFHTNLQLIFDMVKYSKDKEQLRNYYKTHRQELNQMDSVEVAAAFALLGQSKLVEKLLYEEKSRRRERVCV